MKRLLAFLLTILLLALCLCAPASAGSCYVDTVTKTVPLWNADTGVDPYWGNFGQFELDTQNQIEGTGCLSADFSKSYNFSARFAIPEIDTTGLTALELDIYISDLAIWDWLKSTYSDLIMISSAGDNKLFDTQHKRWLSLSLYEGANDTPRVGWNHIVLFFDELYDPAIDLKPSLWGDLQYTPVDMSSINYLHLQLGTDKESSDPSWVLKLDNFVFTDRQKGGHTPGEWKSWGDNHKSFCIVCDEYMAEPHHWGEWENRGDDHMASCIFCDGNIADSHHWGEWQYDETNHWAHCSICNTKYSQTHELSGLTGDENEHWRDCALCDYRGDLGAHTMAQCQYDTFNHWGYCNACNEYVTASHHFGGWVTIKEPTATEDGLKTKTCSGCEYTQKTSIPKTGSPITDDDADKKNEQNNTDTIGCTGMISGAWSVLTVLSLAGWAIRKKQR